MKRKHFVLLSVLMLFGVACSAPETHWPSKKRTVPAFQADSAFQFIEKQLAFGARVPGTDAHIQTGDYLVATLKRYAGNSMVYSQRFEKTVYGVPLQFRNIIAAFNPTAIDRILLCAHWDSRPYADESKMPGADQQPVLGADDGASGVAVLLELARLMSNASPAIGVDIVFFDGEDYGKKNDLDHYFIGSRYWAQQQPVPNYRPRFGILLDMVGAQNAVFPKEGHSMRAAPQLVNQLWSLAQSLGYSNYFQNVSGSPILDDHVILNQYLPFKTIDIIHYKQEAGKMRFADHWHTEFDTIDLISKETLHAVGHLLSELIYNRL